MSLVLKKIPTTTVDVPVQVPGEEKPATIQATWKLHDWASYRATVEAQQFLSARPVRGATQGSA